MSQIALVEFAVQPRRPVPGDGLTCLGPVALPDAARWGLTLWADGRIFEVRTPDGQAWCVDLDDVAAAAARAVAAHLTWAEAAQAGARGIVGSAAGGNTQWRRTDE